MGVIRDPWGAPNGQDAIDESLPDMFTCCDLPVRKLWIHSQRSLVIFIKASFCKRIVWFTKSKAFLKSIKIAWIPFLSNFTLSVASYHRWVDQIRAEMVQRPWVKACWLSFTCRSWLFSKSWIFSEILDSCAEIVVNITWWSHFRYRGYQSLFVKRRIFASSHTLHNDIMYYKSETITKTLEEPGRNLVCTRCLFWFQMHLSSSNLTNRR